MNGTIGLGSAGCGRFWGLIDDGSEVVLLIRSADSVTCSLKREPDGVWRGRREFGERMPVELAPTSIPVHADIIFDPDLEFTPCIDQRY